MNKRVYHSIKFFKRDVVEKFIDTTNISAIIHICCQYGLLDTFIFLNEKFDLPKLSDLTINFGTACIYNQTEMAKYLSSLPTVNVAYNHCFAFRMACEMGNAEIAEHLLKFPNIRPEILDNHALSVASTNGHLEVVKLLSNCPNVKLNDKDNRAFTDAIYYNHLEIVKFLALFPEVYLNIKERDFILAKNEVRDYLLSLDISKQILGYKYEGYLRDFNKQKREV